MSTATIKTQAWEGAEKEVLASLATALKTAGKMTLAVGDEFDLKGKLNYGVFCIEGGGGEQIVETEDAWHTVGRFRGMFATRTMAVKAASVLKSRGFIPLDSTPAKPFTYLCRLYLRDHPTVERQTWKIANQEARAVCVRVEAEFGIFYKEPE